MTLKIDKLFFICLSFMGIVLGSSQAIVNLGLDNVVKYVSYFILISCILLKLIVNRKNIVVGRIFYFILISFLFTIGICLQDLPISKRIYLSFSMLIISSLATLPITLFSTVKEFRRIAYYLLYAVLLSTFLGLVFRVQMLTIAVEGVGSSFGFNGGMLHKNFYAITVLSSYILLFISRKYGVKHDIDNYVLWFELFLIFISNSRTVYLILIVFYCINNWKLLLRINKKQRFLLIFVAVATLLSLVIIFFEYITTNSGSYSVRVQGIINFFNYYHSDYFHLFFGDAKLAFGDSTHDYGYNIRSVTGWNGTVEMPLLSVMIKNGYVGLIGYAIIIASFITSIKRIKNIDLKTIGLLILIPLLMSATVENYIVNISFVFMPVCFCTLNSLKNLKLIERK